MNDMLAYIKLDPIYRKWHHDKLTFSLFYAFSENYILPFSHDEVVHGKHTMLDKSRATCGRNSRGSGALYGYTWRIRAKSCCSWAANSLISSSGSFYDQLEWYLLVYERTAILQHFIRELNHLYPPIPPCGRWTVAGTVSNGCVPTTATASTWPSFGRRRGRRPRRGRQLYAHDHRRTTESVCPGRHPDPGLHHRRRNRRRHQQYIATCDHDAKPWKTYPSAVTLVPPLARSIPL